MTVYDYTDYQSFLSSYFEQRKETDSNWSLSIWASELGLSSRSTLAMILNGQRHPGPSLIRTFIKFFKLSKNEAEYFQYLVLMQKNAKDPGAKANLMEAAAAIHPERAFHILDHKTFSSISHWYYGAIREMTRLVDFKEDPSWIAKCLNFRVTIPQIQRAISDMLALGLLHRDDSGRLIQSEKNITSTDEVASEALKRFHEQCLANTTSAVRSIPVSERYLSGTILTINSKHLSKAKEFVRQFEEEFVRRFEQDQGDITIQLGTNIIPLTKTSKQG